MQDSEGNTTQTTVAKGRDKESFYEKKNSTHTDTHSHTDTHTHIYWGNGKDSSVVVMEK